MRCNAWVWGVALVSVLGCSGGPEPVDDDGGAKPKPPPADAAEVQAQLQQWGDVLEEEHPLAFPGDPESLAWEERKRAAAKGFVDAGADGVPTLHRLLGSKERTAVVLAAAILAEIPGDAATKELRAIVDNANGSMNRDNMDHELAEHAIDGLGRHGAKGDLERLRPFLEGGRPLNTVVMSGPSKRASERRAVLQNAAAEAMARLGDSGGMPALIGNLGGGGWARRDAAIRLQRLTGQRFGFALDAPRPDREASIVQGLEWWEADKATWKPADHPARRSHDIYQRAQ